MTQFRTVHMDMTESTVEIEGEIRFTVYETYGDDAARETIELTFYRPGSGIKNREWLKDMLVQVIEQL